MKKTGLYSFTKTVSRVLQVIMIVAAISCLIGGVIVYFALSDGVIELIKQNIANGNLKISELGVSLHELGDARVAGVFGCLYGFVCTSLGSIIFRNIYKVFKNIDDNATPFTRENVKLVKYIGIYSIIAPFVGGVMGAIMNLAVKNPNITISLDGTSLFMGFVVLCLSQLFAYGVELEDEVEGLV